MCTASPLLCVALITACQFAASPSPTATPNRSAIWQAWEKSPHADTYDLEKGPNTYCARCHSPRNWDPAAKIGEPPNCVSCKFSFESSPRLAESNPLVPEHEWKDIGCQVCHRADSGTVRSEIAWLNAAAGEYEAVDSSTALCEKCHTDTETIKHKRNVDGEAHPDFTCTDCHDPHSTAASCAAFGCHAGVLATDTSVTGHGPPHEPVTCVACHDASGLAVGPLENQDVWITFRTTELLGRSQTKPYQSHYLQVSADCSRCHYVDNPWGLQESVEDTVP